MNKIKHKRYRLISARAVCFLINLSDSDENSRRQHVHAVYDDDGDSFQPSP
jgi:hypothetical protein